MAGKAYIGTSGWCYQGWKDGFYAGVPRRAWLSHCASLMNSIEVNATFYGRQKPNTYERWLQQTPPAFRFSVKANRYLTHIRKLQDPLQSVMREKESLAPLADKLSVILWQLPATLHKDVSRLEAFVEVLDQWSSVRHAIELRHESWFDDEVAACLQQHRLAVCQSDAADWPIWQRVTTDLVYVRLHGHERTYASGYSEEQLSTWARRARVWLAQGWAVHIYFDNDAEGAAPYDVQRLKALVG